MGSWGQSFHKRGERMGEESDSGMKVFRIAKCQQRVKRTTGGHTDKSNKREKETK